MIYKKAIVAIILFVLLINASTIDIIYNNRYYINDLFVNKEHYNFKNGILIKRPHSTALELSKYLKKDKKEWYSNKKNVIKLIVFTSLSTTSFTSVISDSIIMKILVEASKENENSKLAVQRLRYNVSIPLLNNFRKEIIDLSRKKIEEDYARNKKQYDKIAPHIQFKNLVFDYTLYIELMTLSGVEFDTIKNIIPKVFHKMIPDYILARYGNSKIEDKIISDYLKEKDYSERKKILKKICIIGSKKSINTLIKHYWEPIYRRTVGGCIAEFFAVPVTKIVLQRYYPEETVIIKQFSKIRTIQKLLFSTEDYEVEYEKYRKSFNNWAQTKFNITPSEYDNSEKVFSDMCRM